MRTETIKIFQFSELDESAKEKARDWYRVNGLDYEWWDCTIDDIKQALTVIGFYDIDVYFSGFCSQGDGACFIGRYSYEKGALQKVKKDYPQWAELHQLTESLQALQKRYFYQLAFDLVKNGCRYSHEYSVSVGYAERMDGKEINELVFGDIQEITREFMHHIYKPLESEYDYLQSDEMVDDSITANEYEFTETGSIY